MGYDIGKKVCCNPITWNAIIAAGIPLRHKGELKSRDIKFA